MVSRWMALGLAATATCLPTTASAAPAKPAPATLTVVDAHAGSTVDAYANGQLIASGLKGGTVSRPTALPAGSVNLTFTKAGTKTTVASTKLAMAAGSRTSAAYSPAGVTVFNDANTASRSLVVRQLAQTPTLDITVNGRPELTNLDTGSAQSLKISGSTATIAAVTAGTDTAVTADHQITLSNKGATVVYLWGPKDAVKMTTQNLSAVAIPSKVAAGEGPADGSLWQSSGLMVAAMASMGTALYFSTRYRPKHRR